MLYEVSPVYVVSTIFQAVHNNPTAPNSLSLKENKPKSVYSSKYFSVTWIIPFYSVLTKVKNDNSQFSRVLELVSCCYKIETLKDLSIWELEMIFNLSTKKEERVGQEIGRKYQSTKGYFYLACWHQRVKKRHFPHRLLKQKANKLYEEWLWNIPMNVAIIGSKIEKASNDLLYISLRKFLY